MKRSSQFIALLLPAILAAGAVQRPLPAAQESQERVEDYPDLPGRDETFGFCTGCHNFKLVAAQGLTREGWNDTLDWMTQRQGMADIQGEPRELILDYLAAAFPAQRSVAPGGWKNPFSQ
jgi:hypothetical protein